MCQVRAYKHSCGHFTRRHLSNCRGTYACPTSNAVLCNAAPTLTVAHPKPCQSCQYAAFCEDWESRLSEARDKQLVASQMLSGYDDDWDACSELDGGVDIDGNLGSADTANIVRARIHAVQEVERLQVQFQREQWARWRPFLSGGDKSTAYTSQRKRRPSARHPGDSPLKEVIRAEEVAAPEDAVDGDSSRRSSVESEVSDTSSFSSGSLSPGAWSSSFSIGMEEEDVFGSSWGKVLASRLADREESGMLPDWGVA